ncbi:hypothetical protein Gbth_044_008 [Gluconobacter thailandicus F149-1 = NBRC 100600]|uniref:hypothetical protein n=1 Tax=Gluconobacter thailandicus TaxID=257438 RepID=UPI0005DEA07B|nr:hypothetical protein [Gluconobacter thailandicus]GAN94051.1 hypothetical protein Gbth_044_008 [Gluconobacter thailandicus F149-1 = NBRC 100600]GBR58160.1 hypothetical protein AA100600_0642 [Gluconobacter thailandicus F149-1 = NBRC 100600]GEL87632.1 hypothetical protein GTH01_19900 [Gluconobacter thailandicus F149-1 = NBRC 100600]
MNTPFGTSIFCDDVRHEVDNKFSLVGCYGSQMLLNGSAPLKLPTFAVFVKIIFPINYPFKKILVRVYSVFDDQEEEIARANFVRPKELNKVPHPDGGEWKHKVGQFVIPFRWAPFHIPSNGVIYVRAQFDNEGGSEEIRLGALPCRFNPLPPEDV